MQTTESDIQTRTNWHPRKEQTQGYIHWEADPGQVDTSRNQKDRKTDEDRQLRQNIKQEVTSQNLKTVT